MTVSGTIPAAQSRPGNGRQIRVLIADDHDGIRGILRSILTAAPDIDLVGQAENGMEAVEAADRTEPDVILMDLSMPKMDGLEATRRILATHPGMKVIGLSLSVEDERIDAMYDAGARAYLVKGTAGPTLLRAIRSVDRNDGGPRKRIWV